MDNGCGRMSSSEENGFSGFRLSSSQGCWFSPTSMKPIPARRQTADGHGEFQWLSSLKLLPTLSTPELSSHNADLAEASCSGAATASCGNPIGDLNLSAEVYGIDSAAAGGFRSNYHERHVPSTLTEDLTSFITQITGNSSHPTIPAMTHSENDVGWCNRELHQTFPLTPPSRINWSRQQSYMPQLSEQAPPSFDNNSVYGVNQSPFPNAARSDAVTPLTLEEDTWRGVDTCASTCINPSATRELPIHFPDVNQPTSTIPQASSLNYLEQQQVQRGQWNNNEFPSHRRQYGFPISKNKVVYGINPSPSDAAMFGTNTTVGAVLVPITPEKFTKKRTCSSTSSLVNVLITRQLPTDDGTPAEKHQSDELVSQVISDASWIEPSINQVNILRHVADSQPNGTTSVLTENGGDPEKADADGVDLNKTPSQKPKRRKIRPKVIREDKPKRPSNKVQVQQTPAETPGERKKRPYTRKAKESPIGGLLDPVETPTQRKKRPYIRKDKETPITDAVDPAERKKRPYRRKTKETPMTGPTDLDINDFSLNVNGIAPSCKRSLNFDIDIQARQDCSNLQSDAQKPSPGNKDDAENTSEYATFDLNHSINNISSIQVPRPQDLWPSRVQGKESTKWNSNEMPKKKNDLEEVQEKHKDHLSTTASNIYVFQSMKGSSILLSSTTHKDETIVQSEWQSSTQISNTCSHNMPINNPRGPMGLAINPKLTMDMSQALLYQNSGWSFTDLLKYKFRQTNDDTYKPETCQEILKKQKTQRHPQAIRSCLESTSSSQNIGCSGSAAVREAQHSINTNGLTGKSFDDTLASQSFEGNVIMQNKCANHKTSLVVEQQHTKMKYIYGNEKFSISQDVQEHNCVSDQMEEKRNRSTSIYQNYTCHPLIPATGHSLNMSHTVQESFNARIAQACQAALPTERNPPKEPKKQGRKPNSEKNRSSKSNPPAVLKQNSQGKFFLSQTMSPIDEIIWNLRKLDIGSTTVECTVATAENAIVPYVVEGSLVPYEPRRRRPRPKVDLDEETTRVWKLLMGSAWEGIDGTDEDKEKWWEEERKVFRGRADSFIARMHLVQGDRRFSQWKGSVVDSVVGVFLTQNVSDHLSSSAFMALAARFAIKEKAGPTTPQNNECMESAVKDQILPAGRLHNETIQSTKSPLMDVVSTSLAFQHSDHKESIFSEKINNVESCGKVIQEASSSTINRQAAAMIEAKPIELEDGNSVCFSIISSQDSTDSFAQAIDQTGSTVEVSTPAEPINNGTFSNFMQGSFSELLRIAGTPTLFKDLCAKESLYLSLGQKIRTTSDLLLQENWGTNLNKHSESDSSFEIGNKNTIKDMNNNFSAEGSSQVTTFSTENHTTSFPDKATDLQIGCVQHGNQDMPKANLHSHREVEGISNDNALEHSGSVKNEEAENKIDVSKVAINEKARRKIFRLKKGEALTTKEKWDPLRREVMERIGIKERSPDRQDSLDWEAVRHAKVDDVAETIKERGMNHMLAARIQDFLKRLVEDHGSIDLEWLRDVPPDKAKDFLLSINGLGLKSVECVRLLTLHHLAFPVDTNVGRICVRLGWVPLQPLPESLQLHLLELYPVLESIQKYLWPRLCKLDQRTLYELHYQLITFGKVFCTKSRPNCNACPMRGECRHFASAFASARLALPGPEEKSLVSSTVPFMAEQESKENLIHPISLPPPRELPLAVECTSNQYDCNVSVCEPIIEEPNTPEPEYVECSETAIEDFNFEDPDEIPTIKLNLQELTVQVQNYIKDKNMILHDQDMSKALVALTPEAASIPTPKLKNISRLRTEHRVYELPDNHPLLDGLDKRETDDPCSYLLAIWTPGETAESVEPPKATCDVEASGKLCDRETCFSCNAIRETNAQTVRGTLLIPCRTAMRGSFPLNGTYFQVNEVFADHESSLNPIAVSRALLWNLPRRTVYFGTSVTSIFKGLTTEGIQYCFWRGFVCVRGFDQKTRAPRPLMARLHFPASKQTRDKRKMQEV